MRHGSSQTIINWSGIIKWRQSSVINFLLRPCSPFHAIIAMRIVNDDSLTTFVSCQERNM